MRVVCENIHVWQMAHQMTLMVFAVTRSFPPEEKFGLTDDMRRAARSVPTNFVEGFKRHGHKDALNFFNRSDASLAELGYHTLLSFELGYLSKVDADRLEQIQDEVGRLLNRWQKCYRPFRTL